jgi:signal peptidase II
LIIAVLAAFVFVLDRVTKTLVQTRMASGASIPVIPGLLRITYTRNAGAAFGLLQHQTLFFIAVTVAVVILIVTYGGRAARGQPALAVALGLQLGGALGNLVDRLRVGTVVDFIDFYRIWPFIFNVADAALVTGGLLFALILIRQDAVRGGLPHGDGGREGDRKPAGPS